MPINTYSNKAPFIGKIKSVQRIVGPKATGETMHIIIETNVSIPPNSAPIYKIADIITFERRARSPSGRGECGDGNVRYRVVNCY